MHVFRGKYGKNRYSSRVKDGKGELREQQTQSSDSICPHAPTGDQRRKKSSGRPSPLSPLSTSFVENTEKTVYFPFFLLKKTKTTPFP